MAAVPELGMAGALFFQSGNRYVSQTLVHFSFTMPKWNASLRCKLSGADFTENNTMGTKSRSARFQQVFDAPICSWWRHANCRLADYDRFSPGRSLQFKTIETRMQFQTAFAGRSSSRWRKWLCRESCSRRFWNGLDC